MNPTFASSFDWTVPDGVAWLVAYAGFLAVGCGLVGIAGLLLLAREAIAAWRSGLTEPATWQAEFMGYGVAKERYRARPSRSAPHSTQTAGSPTARELRAPTPSAAV